MKLPAVLPDGFLKSLPPEERKKLGHHLGGKFRALQTSEEARAKYVAKSEKELQRDVADWLRANGIPFFSPRMDKRTTIQLGMPDFLCCLRRGEDGLFVALECKCRLTRGKLSDEQERRMAEITASAGIYLVIFSVDELARALAKITSL